MKEEKKIISERARERETVVEKQRIKEANSEPKLKNTSIVHTAYQNLLQNLLLLLFVALFFANRIRAMHEFRELSRNTNALFHCR